jgi:hypothetical protein
VQKQDGEDKLDPSFEKLSIKQNQQRQEHPTYNERKKERKLIALATFCVGSAC